MREAIRVENLNVKAVVILVIMASIFTYFTSSLNRTDRIELQAMSTGTAAEIVKAAAFSDEHRATLEQSGVTCSDFTPSHPAPLPKIPKLTPEQIADPALLEEVLNAHNKNLLKYTQLEYLKLDREFHDFVIDCSILQ